MDAALPAAGDGGSFFAAVLATTQRQLTSSLGGMLAVTSASLLVWLLTKAAERLLALARGVLFVTVEVSDRKLSAAVRAWAALHAHSAHRSPGAFFATRTAPSQLLLERAKRAVAAAKDAPARLGNKLVFPVLRSNVAGCGARSDPTSYAVFEHTPPGPSSEDQSELQQIVWLQKRPVWLHSSLEGGRGSSLLAGAPAPLLRLLDSSGLRELFASAGTSKVTTERESRRSRSGREQASVFVSALRWQAGTLLRAALQAAFEQSCAEERGLLRVRSVKIVTEDDDPRHRFRELLGGETIVGELIWEKHPPMLARGMRTIVLPAAAEELRSAAQRFMSPSYKAFCRSKGIAHRAGYALWGPPGCGKTSFVSALAAELGATLYLLYLDGQRMNNASVKKLLRSMTLGRCVLLIEDADAAMPEDFGDAAGANAAGELSRPASAAAGFEATDSLQAPTAADNDGEDGGDEGKEDEEEEEEEEARDADLGSLFGLGAMLPGSKAAKDKKSKKKKAPGLTLAGLLEALTGPGSPEGCLLFLTTNHIDRLPRQLRQPGVVDAAVEFSLGTVAMIEALFINFYLLSDDSADDDWAVDGSAPPPPRLAAATSTGVPANVVRSLAAAFAERCGDRKVGLATVQGHLLDHRDDPQAALSAPFSERRVPGGGVSAADASDATAASAGGLAPAESTGDVLMRQRRLMRTLSLQPMPSARSVSSQQHQPDAAPALAPQHSAPMRNASVRLRAPRGFTHPAGPAADDELLPTMLRAASSMP